MSFYQDRNVRIDEEKIRVRGVLMPMISNIVFDAKEVEKLEEIELSKLDRVSLLGTRNLKTWWCFDAFRPFKKKGFRITIKESVGPFKEVAFTVSDMTSARKVLKDNFKSKFKTK